MSMSHAERVDLLEKNSHASYVISADRAKLFKLVHKIVTRWPQISGDRVVDPLDQSIRFESSTSVSPISVTLNQVLDLVPQRSQHIMGDRKDRLPINRSWLSNEIMNLLMSLLQECPNGADGETVFGYDLGYHFEGINAQVHGGLQRQIDILGTVAVNHTEVVQYKFPATVKKIVWLANPKGLHWITVITSLGDEQWKHSIYDPRSGLSGAVQIDDGLLSSLPLVERLIQEYSGFPAPRIGWDDNTSLRFPSAFIQQPWNDSTNCGPIAVETATMRLLGRTIDPAVNKEMLRYKYLQYVYEAIGGVDNDDDDDDTGGKKGKKDDSDDDDDDSGGKKVDNGGAKKTEKAPKEKEQKGLRCRDMKGEADATSDGRTCSRCKHSFKDATGLRRHLKNLTDGPFACSAKPGCGKKDFATQETEQRHSCHKKKKQGYPKE